MPGVQQARGAASSAGQGQNGPQEPAQRKLDALPSMPAGMRIISPNAWIRSGAEPIIHPNKARISAVWVKSLLCATCPSSRALRIFW